MPKVKVIVNIQYGPVSPEQEKAWTEIWQRLLQPLPKKNAPGTVNGGDQGKGETLDVSNK